MDLIDVAVLYRQYFVVVLARTHNVLAFKRESERKDTPKILRTVQTVARKNKKTTAVLQ